jgi:hypothetical protein
VQWVAGSGPPEPIGPYPELRRSVAGQRILYASLAFGIVLGLAAHIGGYLLRSLAPGEPLGLVVDLLYALGYALWTGVVVVLFVQVVPEAKRRQMIQALDAYEQARWAKARAAARQEASRTSEASNGPAPR